MNNLFKTLKDLNNNYEKPIPKFKEGDTCYVVRSFYILETTVISYGKDYVKYKIGPKDGWSCAYLDRVFKTAKEADKYFKNRCKLEYEQIVEAVALQHLAATGEPVVLSRQYINEHLKGLKKHD